MVDEKMFAQVVEAIEKGQRSRAKDLLTRLLKTDQRNPDQWLWMSSVVDSRKEQIYCLESVLRLDPENKAAKRALILLGGMEPGEGVVPVPPVRRKWVDELEEVEVEEEKQKSPATSGKVLGYISAGVIVIGLILGAIFIPGGRGLFQPKLTITPHTWTPTISPVPVTPSPAASSTPVPMSTGMPSLSSNLEATYTPTPPYVLTPHPQEAYQIAMRAYYEGNYEKMLNFMQQIADADETADAYFYVGEAHRLLGQYSQAIRAYNKSLSANYLFAPAYLGRAQAKLAQDPYEEVEEDLTRAIENDPGYGAAYLERAAYWLLWHQPEAALEDAQTAALLLPDSPFPYLYQAQALLALGEVEGVLALAEKTQSLDITIVDTYLVLGQMYLADGNPEKSLENLKIYDVYSSENPLEYLVTLGQAYYEVENYEEAVEIFTDVLDVDDDRIEILIYRGLAYIELGEFQSAINDTYAARELEPNSFRTGFALGKAFFAAKRYDNADSQFKAQVGRAEDDVQLAQAYYWWALTLEELGDVYEAREKWQALLELPVEAVPEAWLAEAEAHLHPTPTETSTPTSTPTLTPTPTDTPEE
ncbi:MAG: hypothetical protein DRI56_04300 [Chloroflexota bacterium]|nr:MAG: hypothetical protein DRI56_04300 [Chloroflexota bacterium]